MKLFALVLAGLCSAAVAGVDNVVVAANEAAQTGSSGLPGASIMLGLAAAAFFGWSGRKDGQALVGAAVGFAIGSAAGLVLDWALLR